MSQRGREREWEKTETESWRDIISNNDGLGLRVRERDDTNKEQSEAHQEAQMCITSEMACSFLDKWLLSSNERDVYKL